MSKRLFVASRLPADWAGRKRADIYVALNQILASHNKHVSFTPEAWDEMFAAGEWVVAIACHDTTHTVLGVVEIEHLVPEAPSYENRAIIHGPLFDSLEGFDPQFVAGNILRLACEITLAASRRGDSPLRITLVTGTPAAEAVARTYGSGSSGSGIAVLTGTPLTQHSIDD